MGSERDFRRPKHSDHDRGRDRARSDSHRYEIAPGKVTLTQNLRGPSPARLFEMAVEEGHAQVPLLRAAIAARDFDEVIIPTLRAEQCLRRAREHVGAQPDGARGLAELEQALAPLLAEAPQMSREAVHDRYSRRDARAWDAERERWLAVGTSAASEDADQAPAIMDELAGEQGQALADGEAWSARVGADVSHARIVTGPRAAAAATAIGARAFTVGDRVFMGAGNDATTDGGGLLAH